MAGRFEWIVDFPALQVFLGKQVLEVPPQAAALVVGCGRSALSGKLKGLFAEVLSIDNDPAVIEEMRQAEPSLRWLCADCCSAEAMSAALYSVSPSLAAGGAFDVVVDKGTLDAVLCEDGAAGGFLCECHRALKPGGVYLCVSLRRRALLDRLLGPGSPCDWTYDPRSAPGEAFTVALCRRQGSEPACLQAMRAHCDEALEAFFAETPLLTPEREAAVAHAFARAAPSGHLASASLSLGDVHEMLFTEAEREEYTLEAFVEDAAVSRHARVDPTRMSLEEALAFLQENQ